MPGNRARHQLRKFRSHPVRRSSMSVRWFSVSSVCVLLLTLLPILPTEANSTSPEPVLHPSEPFNRGLASAQPPITSSPSISLSVPAQVPLGSNVSFTVTFDNGDPVDEGYGPILDIILDTTGADADSGGGPYDGLGTSSITASYLGIPFTSGGANPTMWVLSFDALGEATHPLLRDADGQYLTVTGTPGDSLVVLRLPFGSFSPDQPPITVDMSVNMSNFADLGIPLAIQARGAYEFGYTPLDDWCCGDPGSNTVSGWVSSSVTPTLLTLAKSYTGPEDEAVSGPNFRTFYPMRFDVSVSIAPGQSLSVLTLDDLLPANLQYFDLISSSPSGASCSEPVNPPPPPESPGGALSCSWPGSIAGSASLSFDFYIPLENSAGGRVISPFSGDDATSCNNASLSASWTPLDPRDVGGLTVIDPGGCEFTLTDKSIAIQKTVSNLTDGSHSPDDVLEYTLRIQVSDFFAFNNLIMTDVVSDGQRVDASFSPTLEIQGNPFSWPATAMLSTPLTDPINWTYDVDCNYSGAAGGECTTDSGGAPNDGTTTLTFRLSQEILQRGLDGSGRMVGGCVEAASGSADPDCSAFNDGPTYAILRFRTVIQDAFSDDYPSGDDSVDQGDVLGNGVSIVGDVLDTASFASTGSTETDDSSASLSIGTGTLSKSIFALNGASPGSPAEVKPGDELTYRITYTLPTGDEENLEFNDYLPLPIFQVGDPDNNGTSGPGDPPPWVFNAVQSSGVSDIPAPGEAMFGPADTFYTYTCLGTGTPAGCLAPTLTSDITNNSLRFDFGDFDGPTESTYTVDLLFTVTVSDDPFADRLYLTNQANAFEGSTNAGTVSANDIVQIILTEPVLLSKKAVIWASNPNAIFDPTTTGPVTFLSPASAPRWSGTINSTNLASAPIDSNVRFVDAGDTVSFAIVIENTGSSINGAYDIVVRDSLPAEFQIPAGGPNLQIYYGDGSGPIAFNGLGGGGATPDDDLFYSGIELIDPGGVGVCQAYDPTLGNNVILITFDLELRDDVTPGTIVNTESLVRYAGSEGGPNHLATLQTDQAETTVSPVTTKAIVSSEIEDGVNERQEGVIGELVTYRLTIAIPEGNIPGAQLVDTLDSGLAFVQIDSVSTSPGVSHNAIDLGSTPTNPALSGAGGVLTFDLGDVDNPNDSDVVETIEIVYTAIVLNVSGNQDGTPLNNSAVFSWNGGSLPASNAPNLAVIEPKLLVTKLPSPNQGDAGDTISLTLTIEHDQETVLDPEVSSTHAYELALSDPLPAGMTYVGSGLDCTAGDVIPDTYGFAANTLTATWNQPTGLPFGDTTVCTFDITLDASVSPGQVINNIASLTWTSLSGDVSTARSTHNSTSVERTGIGGLNDYSTQGTGAVTITSGPAKSIVSTSEAYTGFDGTYERVVIGEVIRYRLTYQIAEGTALNFRLQDDLPPGLRFIDDGTAMAMLVSNDAGMVSSDYPPATNPGLYVTGSDSTIGTLTPGYVLPDNAVASSATDRNADTYNSGSDVYFWFGDLVNNDRDVDLEYVVVEFNAVTENVAGSQAYDNASGALLTTNLDNRFRSRLGSGASELIGSWSAIVRARIAEPLINNLAKTITITPSDAGDTVEYLWAFSNTSSGTQAAAAFDLELRDTLDANLVYQNLELLSVTGGDCGSITPSFNGNVAGQLITGTLTCLNPGGTATIRLTATVVNNAPIAGTIDNSVDLTYTSLPAVNGTAVNPTGSTTPGAPGTVTGERTGASGAGGLNDYVDIASVSLTLIDPAITKSVFGTSLVTTGSSQHDPAIEDLVIGETVTFRITVTLPEGSAPLTITDNLPTVPPDQGILSVVSSQVIAIGADISGSLLSVGNAGVVSDSDSDTYTDQVVFSFGTLLNTPDGIQDDEDRITVEVVALVENHPSIQDGDLLVNDATVDYGTGTLTDSAPVEIVVLDLAVTKDDSLSIISPAEVLTYVINFSNVGTADAYGVTLTETVPFGTAFSGPSGPGGWSCAAGAPGGTTCTYAAGDLSIGASGSVDFIVVVNDPAGVTSVTNTVTVGDDSSHGPDINPANNSDTDIDNLATLPDANLTKTVVDTDQGFTTGADTAIGEIITYEVTLIVPEGTAPASLITDTLERGLAFVDCVSTSVSGNLTTNRVGGFPAACSNPSVVEEPPGSVEPVDEGRRITFNLGDLTSTKSNPTDPDPTLTITYRVVVLDSAVNLRGVDLTNAARWTWNGGDLLRSAGAVTIVEPSLTLRKSASPRISPLGTPITITLSVGHAGSSDADAFDLVLEDILPPELLFAGGLSSTSGLAPTTLTESGGTINATWDDFPLGSTSTVEFLVTLDGLSPGQLVSNEARLEWTSLPADGVSAPYALSPHNALATERRYDPTNLVDVYQVTATESLGVPALPETGFPPERLTEIPAQAPDQSYQQLDGMRLVIPSLDLEAEIVGVFTNEQGWDLTWLWNRIGYLEGTAYPSWVGNTILTGHIVLPNGLPGPFASLNQLGWNDRIWLYTNGLRYEYQVTYQWRTHPNDLSVFRHEDLDVLTLITCANYDPVSEKYSQRTIVRAVLVGVEPQNQHP